MLSSSRFTARSINAIGATALILASTGTAYAVGAKVAKNSVGTKQIKTGGVHNKDIGKAAVSNSKIGPAAVSNSKLGASSVSNSKIAASAVTNSKLGTAAVTPSKIAAGSITTDKIADRTITREKLSGGLLADGFSLSLAGVNTDPATSPDGHPFVDVPFTPSATGHVYVALRGTYTQGCSAGAAQYGIYVDGTPVPGSRATSASGVSISAVSTAVYTAGSEHRVKVIGDCPSGNATTNAGPTGDAAITVIVLPT